MTNSTVYIDESGDLGFQRGSKWFVMTAVIIDVAEEKAAREQLRKIRSKINVSVLHLRKITEFFRRAYIAGAVNDIPFTYINIIVDTSKLTLSKEKSTSIAYNFICRLLIERVSWFLRDTNRQADIVLSSRGTSKDNDLIQYINETLLKSNNTISKENINEIKALSAGTWEMLQLADICATTTFSAYEVSGWGYRVPCYLRKIYSHLYRYNGDVMGYGIKYFSADMEPEKGEMNSLWPCK